MCPHGAHMNAAPPGVVVHLHGGHVAAADDGYPEDAFPPGGELTYLYPNDQLPATLWYHDHALGITRLNVIMGLAGFYLIGDDTETALGLPAGANDIGLAIQDRTFNADGSFSYPAMWMEHFFGNTILVNGRVWPYLNVNRGKYRFRMLNGSTSRTYTLSLSNGAAFHQIGSDGGLLAAPLAMTQLTIAPAERADVVIDFESYAPGTQIVLTNSAPAPFPGSPGAGVVPNVMKFIVGASTGHIAPLPPTLRSPVALQESESVLERPFELRKLPEACSGTAWFINGMHWDDITEFPVLGTTEVWSFINRSGMMHPMHMHLVMFQILDRQAFVMQGETVVPTGPILPPDPNEAGWKDTVRCNPFEITRVIARFTDFTGLFAYHCHILEHEDHEMMRQFRAVCRKGDTNQDTRVDAADIPLFVDTLLTSGSPGTAAFCATDMDDDAILESDQDVAAFVDCLVNAACP
ncbi:MAG: multicopper oxidase domain-containing protein [Planctomycetes bacterium]|nr:multicopper oxidase domain-containing protein [Planctomycetota bacterium]